VDRLLGKKAWPMVLKETFAEDKMKTGDLVQHRIDRSYGIVIEARGKPTEMVRVFWHTHNLIVLHTTRQVEVINEK